MILSILISNKKMRLITVPVQGADNGLKNLAENILPILACWKMDFACEKFESACEWKFDSACQNTIYSTKLRKERSDGRSRIETPPMGGISDYKPTNILLNIYVYYA